MEATICGALINFDRMAYVRLCSEQDALLMGTLVYCRTQYGLISVDVRKPTAKE